MELSLFEIMQRTDSTNRDVEYKKRKYSYSTIEFNLKHLDDNNLFSVISLSMMDTINKIKDTFLNKNYIRFNTELKNSVFYAFYINKLFEDELIATNEIEGINSTRKEIKDALENLNKVHTKKEKRFQFLVKKYNQLLNEEYTNISTIQDIRTTYDELLKNEISKDDLPDGLVFRKSGVDVTTASGKIIHRGIVPEDEIISRLTSLIDLMNNHVKESYEKLIDISVFHYYFGYIHPFYDGNGRINRFITSTYVAQQYDLLLALKLSKVIKDNQKKYYSAFNNTNKRDNYSDMTHFISVFLDFFYEASQEVLTEITIYINKLDNFFEIVKSYDDLDEKDKNIIFLVYQSEILNAKLTKSEIAKEMKMSSPTISKKINKLASDGYLIFQKRMPLSLGSKIQNQLL